MEKNSAQTTQKSILSTNPSQFDQGFQQPSKRRHKKSSPPNQQDSTPTKINTPATATIFRNSFLPLSDALESEASTSQQSQPSRNIPSPQYSTPTMSINTPLVSQSQNSSSLSEDNLALAFESKDFTPYTLDLCGVIIEMGFRSRTDYDTLADHIMVQRRFMKSCQFISQLDSKLSASQNACKELRLSRRNRLLSSISCFKNLQSKISLLESQNKSLLESSQKLESQQESSTAALTQLQLENSELRESLSKTLEVQEAHQSLLLSLERQRSEMQQLQEANTTLVQTLEEEQTITDDLRVDFRQKTHLVENLYDTVADLEAEIKSFRTQAQHSSSQKSVVESPASTAPDMECTASQTDPPSADSHSKPKSLDALQQEIIQLYQRNGELEQYSSLKQEAATSAQRECRDLRNEFAHLTKSLLSRMESLQASEAAVTATMKQQGLALETLLHHLTKLPPSPSALQSPTPSLPMGLISPVPSSNPSSTDDAHPPPPTSPPSHLFYEQTPSPDKPPPSDLSTKSNQLSAQLDSLKKQHVYDQKNLFRQSTLRDTYAYLMKSAKGSTSPSPHSPASIYNPSDRAVEILSNSIQFLHTLPEPSRRLITQRAQGGRRIFTFGLDRTPSDDEAAAIARISLLLLDLSSSDRGYVCTHLNKTFNAKPPHWVDAEYAPLQQPTTTPPSHEGHRPSPKPRKQAWKVTWHKSDEYVKFKHALDMKPLTNYEEIHKLWLPAQQLRDKLRAEWQSQTPTDPPPSSPPPTAKPHRPSIFASGFGAAISGHGDY